jgi:hypothetical protein
MKRPSSSRFHSPILIGLFLLLFAVLAGVTQILRPFLVAEAEITTTTPIYWGATIKNDQGYAPWSTAVWDDFESRAQKKVSMLGYGQAWYTEADWPNGFYPFSPYYMDLIRSRGAIPVLTWGSFDYNKGPNQPGFALKKIANGSQYGMWDYGKNRQITFDEYVTTFATSTKNWGHPVMIRFNWEMNGWWQFPWATAKDPYTGATVNGNTPADYVAAWRHVHDIFQQVGATNVTWIWCPNVSSTPTVPLSQLYPGDAYVDWTCLDGYNKDAQVWQTFTEVFTGSSWNGSKNSYQEIVAVAPTKPIMLGEFGSNESTTDPNKKANWITDAFLTQLPQNFPKIKAILWFNWNSDAGSSWAIESSTVSQQAFASAIGTAYYATNSFANLANGKVVPLTTGVISSPIPSPSPVASANPSPTPSFDSIPPQLTVEYPVGEIRISSGARITFKASATDNVKVQRVDFMINDTVVCSDYKSSYSCTPRLKGNSGSSITYSVKAYDTAGNTVTSPVSKITFQ